MQDFLQSFLINEYLLQYPALAQTGQVEVNLSLQSSSETSENKISFSCYIRILLILPHELQFDKRKCNEMFDAIRFLNAQQ